MDTPPSPAFTTRDSGVRWRIPIPVGAGAPWQQPAPGSGTGRAAGSADRPAPPPPGRSSARSRRPARAWPRPGGPAGLRRSRTAGEPPPLDDLRQSPAPTRPSPRSPAPAARFRTRAPRHHQATDRARQADVEAVGQDADGRSARPPRRWRSPPPPPVCSQMAPPWRSATTTSQAATTSRTVWVPRRRTTGPPRPPTAAPAGARRQRVGRQEGQDDVEGREGTGGGVGGPLEEHQLPQPAADARAAAGRRRGAGGRAEDHRLRDQDPPGQGPQPVARAGEEEGAGPSGRRGVEQLGHSSAGQCRSKGSAVEMASPAPRSSGRPRRAPPRAPGPGPARPSAPIGWALPHRAAGWPARRRLAAEAAQQIGALVPSTSAAHPSAAAGVTSQSPAADPKATESPRRPGRTRRRWMPHQRIGAALHQPGGGKAFIGSPPRAARGRAWPPGSGPGRRRRPAHRDRAADRGDRDARCRGPGQRTSATGSTATKSAP